MLVLDPDADAREIVGSILEDHQYGAILAPDRQMALRALRGLSVDFLIADPALLRSGPLGVARMLAEILGGRRIPILILSAELGCDDVEEEIALRDLGVREFLRKPFRPSHLLQCVRQALEGRVAACPHA
ncbi:MAG: response regulator transcription factor [Planctomycetes bacterium]|nr:response regulator transcription factor [Planctomycetota bacterium]